MLRGRAMSQHLDSRTLYTICKDHVLCTGTMHCSFSKWPDRQTLHVKCCSTATGKGPVGNLVGGRRLAVGRMGFTWAPQS